MSEPPVGDAPRKPRRPLWLLVVAALLMLLFSAWRACA